MTTQATIMKRPEQGFIFHDLMETMYVRKNSKKAILERNINEFTEKEMRIFFLKYHHEEGTRIKIEKEKLKKRNKRIEAINDALLEIVDDFAFMRKMSSLIDKACDDMDLKDAESARQETERIRAETKLIQQDTYRLKLVLQYLEEGHSSEEAEELARKALDTKVVN